jgi:hypothetical protein
MIALALSPRASLGPPSGPFADDPTEATAWHFGGTGVCSEVDFFRPVIHERWYSEAARLE